MTYPLPVNTCFFSSSFKQKREILVFYRDRWRLFINSEKKKYVSILGLIGISLLPVDLLSQTEAGAISRSQCVTSGGTPANIASLRNAVDMGLGFYWESADDAGFTTGLVSNLSLNSQTLIMAAHITARYYRRVVPTGLAPPSDFYYSNVVKISIVGSTNAPIFFPTAVSPICEGNSSFTVSYILFNSPTKYSIIWNAAPAALGFIDVIEQNLPGSSPLTVNVSATAPAGTYSGTLIPLDANGCSIAGTNAGFTFNPLPTVSITAPVAICAPGTIDLTSAAITVGSTSGLAYTQWNNLAATSALTNANAITATGVYYIKGTVGATGCAVVKPVTATVNALPTPTISPGSATTFCAGGSVNLTATLANFYLWSTGETSQSVLATTSGGRTVTITDVNGCSAASSTTAITVNALPTPTISPGSTTTFCAGGSVNLTATLASFYLWSTGETTQSVLATTSGGRTVTITDVNGCSATSSAATVTVNALPSPTIGPGGPTTFCVGGAVNLTATAASFYSWSTGETTQSILATTSGGRTVTITDVNGCSGTSSITTVAVNALPSPTISPSSTTTFCVGGSVNLTATAASFYSWNTGETTQTALATTSGGRTVTITDVNGCSATSSTTTVTVNALPTATITPVGATTFCAGGSVNLTATAASLYLWSTGESTQSVIATTSGGRTVTITDVNGCSATSSPTTVTVNTLPVATITPASTTTFCVGGSVNLTATTANLYLWSTGESTQSVIATTSGGRTVTITDVNGCSAISSPTGVTVNALPVATITPASATTFCVGGSVNLTATAANLYSWSTGQTTQSILATTSGGRTVTITDVNGCSATAATNVTVNPLPVATITALNPTTFCAGGSVTLTASAASSYSWSSGQTTQSILVITSGGRTVTITDVNGCSATSSAATVTVNALPVATITALNPTTFCAGGSVTLTASAGNSYSWSNGQTTQSINVSTGGNKTVTVTGANGCSAISSPILVTVNALPTATITAITPTTFCAGGSVTLTASAGSSYSWSSGQTTQSINVSTTGNRSVTVTDLNGCSGISSPTVVTANPLPSATINIGGPTTFCAGGSVNLTATAGTSWLWNTGASSQSISANTAGNKTVTVTDANGCTATSAPVNIVVNTLPVLTITNPSSVCSPATVNLTLPAVTNGTTPGANFSYWANAAGTTSYTTPSAVGLSGLYYIKATVPSTGCSSIQPVTVSVNAPPVITITNPAAVCEPATVDLTASAITVGSGAGITFSYWTNAANTNAVATPSAINASGTYYVRGITANGCFASLPVTVAVNPLPNGTLQTPAVNYICDGTPLILRASNSFGYQWYSDQTIIAGATTDTYAATKSGNYTVQFISQEGCTKNATNTIRLDLLTKPVIQFAATSTCIATPVGFTNSSNITSSGGLSWLWDFGDGSSSNNFSATHTYTIAGTYNVSLTANNASCSSFTEKKTVALVISAPQPAIRYDTIQAVGGKSFSLNARSIGVSYLWNPSTGLNNTTTRSPIVTLTKDLDYTVRITSSAGCITTDSVYVKVVNEGEIYVPQGFTPNNDGVNDRAYPILVGIRQLVYFKIFNRWGNLVFQTNDATPQNGWDGKLAGKIQPVATYTWTAEGIDGNGNSIRRSGSILLIN